MTHLRRLRLLEKMAGDYSPTWAAAKSRDKQRKVDKRAVRTATPSHKVNNLWRKARKSSEVAKSHGLKNAGGLARGRTDKPSRIAIGLKTEEAYRRGDRSEAKNILSKKSGS